MRSEKEANITNRLLDYENVFFFFSGYFKAVGNPVICQSLLAEYSKRNRIVMCVCTRSRVGLTKGGGNDVHCDRRQTMCVCIFTHHIRALALSSCHSNKPDCVKSFCLSKDQGNKIYQTELDLFDICLYLTV